MSELDYLWTTFKRFEFHESCWHSVEASMHLMISVGECDAPRRDAVEYRSMVKSLLQNNCFHYYDELDYSSEDEAQEAHTESDEILDFNGEE